MMKMGCLLDRSNWSGGKDRKGNDETTMSYEALQSWVFRAGGQLRSVARWFRYQEAPPGIRARAASLGG